MTIDIETASLGDLRNEAKRLSCETGPFSRNMLGLVLRQIDDRFGEPEATKAIEELGLEL
jgi:hypothetical protein